MPPLNRPFNGPPTAGVIAVSIAVAAAIAIYESEELQRMADDLRRRIAIALHAFGDSITPQERENLFNRPEDAEGFLQSRGLGRGSVPGVEADAESLRRQREELMYWNAIRESQKEEEKRHRPKASTSSSFDDFLQQDANAEKGAFVYQTSVETANTGGLVRRRGTAGLRGLNYSVTTDPFADEHGIESDIAFENSLIEPGQDEMSDIYSATDVGAYQSSRTLSPEQQEVPAPSIGAFPSLVEVEEALEPQEPLCPLPPLQIEPFPPNRSTTLSPELADDEYMTAGQDREAEDEKDTAAAGDAYSSIQAWAQSSASHDASFYSPLTGSPAAPASEANTDADFVTDGEMTPTDSASLAGSGVDVARAFDDDHDDVISRSSGMDTPTSWTDVESAAGESEDAIHV